VCNIGPLHDTAQGSAVGWVLTQLQATTQATSKMIKTMTVTLTRQQNDYNGGSDEGGSGGGDKVLGGLL